VIGSFSTPYEASKSILACFIAFLFGFFSGYYTAYFYYGGEMDLTDANTLGALGTWFGSIATAFTFGFLIWQNTKIRQQQKATEDRQQSFEKQQQALWDSQQVKIRFEMLQSHKREFFRVLDDIETSSKTTIKFYDREELYCLIFPKNNYKNNLAGLTLQANLNTLNPDRNNQLDNIYLSYSAINSSLIEIEQEIIPFEDKLESNKDQYLYFLRNLENWIKAINIKITPKVNFGDVRLEDSHNSLLVNIYNPNEVIDILKLATKQIFEFSGVKMFDSESLFLAYFYKNKLQEMLLTDTSIHNYSVSLDKYGYAGKLYLLYKYFSQKDVREADNSENYTNIANIVKNKDKFTALLKDLSALKTLLNNFNFNIQSLETKGEIPKVRVTEFRLIHNTFDINKDIYDEKNLSKCI